MFKQIKHQRSKIWILQEAVTHFSSILTEVLSSNQVNYQTLQVLNFTGGVFEDLDHIFLIWFTKILKVWKIFWHETFY